MATLSKAHDLRSLGGQELLDKLRESKAELFNLRFQSATGQLDSHGGLKTVRRDIARIYTVMRERELGISPAPEGDTAPAGADGDGTDDEGSAEGTA